MTTVTGKSLEHLIGEYHAALQSAIVESHLSQILFAHFGNFNQNKVDQIIKITESSLTDAGDRRQGIKRLLNVLIENLQNISLHSAVDKSARMFAYCTIVREENAYRLLSGNLVLSDDIEIIESRMNDLISLDKTALRKLYIETLCNEDFNYKGGAGLGLLTIAKRAADGIRYKVQRIGEDFGYFQMDFRIAFEK
jgi:hypothetical protein